MIPHQNAAGWKPLHMCEHALSLYALHLCRCLQRPEDALRYSWTGSYRQLCVTWVEGTELWLLTRPAYSSTLSHLSISPPSLTITRPTHFRHTYIDPTAQEERVTQEIKLRNPLSILTGLSREPSSTAHSQASGVRKESSKPPRKEAAYCKNQGVTCSQLVGSGHFPWDLIASGRPF